MSHRLPFLTIVLVSLFFCSGVSALRYPEQDNFTFPNAPCSTLVSGSDPYLNSDTCVKPYLTTDDSDTFNLGFVSNRYLPDAFFLSIYWRAVGPFNDIVIVWSANRNAPVSQGAYFTFQNNGSLVLYDGGGKEVWSTQTDHRGAQGLDLDEHTGNLIVYGSKNETLWQSSDSPTDTLLQGFSLQWGMKLVSNFSVINGSEGSYSLVMEPGGLVLYANLPDPRPYWTWGYYAQQDITINSVAQSCRSPVELALYDNGFITFTFNPNISLPQNLTSPALCTLNFTGGIGTDSFATVGLTRFMKLESDGTLRVYRFNTILTEDYNLFGGVGQCNLPTRCSAYGVCKSDGQCSCPAIDSPDLFTFVPNNPFVPQQGCNYTGGIEGISCSKNASGNIKDEIHHMAQLDKVDYYWNRYTLGGNKTALEECESLCMNDCSCTASFYNAEIGSCYRVSEPLLSLRSSNNSNLTAFIKVNGGKPSAGSSSNNLALIMGVLVGCLFILVAVVGLLTYYLKRRAKIARNSEEDAFLETLPGLPPRFSMKELGIATSGFSETLGAGGFGTVYEGTLPDGTKVAVKKLESAKGTKDFRAEMATLGSIHHINLVRLRGFCAEGLNCMLVYEYMPKGSVDRWLFRTDLESASSLTQPLDWDTRFKIALGTARGLQYLHDECSERIIHLDVKPQNVLLDDNFLPKVSDFGLSKLVDRDMSLVVTTMRGTPGYLAPEWLLQSAVTDRTDVFSYGILVLELVAGRKSLDHSHPVPDQRYLPAWGLQLIMQGKPMNMVDKVLETYDKEQVTRVIHIAFLCIQEEMMQRPSMRLVVQMLEGLAEVPDFDEDTAHSRYRFAKISNMSSSYSTDPSTDVTSPYSSSFSTETKSMLSAQVLSQAR